MITDLNYRQECVQDFRRRGGRAVAPTGTKIFRHTYWRGEAARKWLIFNLPAQPLDQLNLFPPQQVELPPQASSRF